jgi:predicted transcriptional regulator
MLRRMTTLLDQAVNAVRQLSPEEQDELARVLLQLVGHEQPAVTLTPAEAASFDESLRQAERGEFATEQEVQAIWSKHGL